MYKIHEKIAPLFNETLNTNANFIRSTLSVNPHHGAFYLLQKKCDFDPIPWQIVNNANEFVHDLVLFDCFTILVGLEKNQNPVILQKWMQNLDKKYVDYAYQSLAQNPTPWAIQKTHAYLDTLDEKERKLFLSKMDGYFLSSNESNEAIALLQAYPQLIYWSALSRNSNLGALCLLEKNLNKISWSGLSRNSNVKALMWLEIFTDKIDWTSLSGNPNEKAVDMLLQHPEKIHWPFLCENTNIRALQLLEQFPEHICTSLCKNPTDAAIALLNKYPQHIDWNKLADNPNPNIATLFVHILSHNCIELLKNPHIFVYDYAAIRDHKKCLHQDLCAYLFHPKNIAKFLHYQFYEDVDVDVENDA